MKICKPNLCAKEYSEVDLSESIEIKTGYLIDGISEDMVRLHCLFKGISYNQITKVSIFNELLMKAHRHNKKVLDKHEWVKV